VFTAIDDDSFHITRDPVERETNGPSSTLKDYDMIRDNRTAFTSGSTYEPDPYFSTCCQVLRCLASVPGDRRGAPNIGSLSVTWLKNEWALSFTSELSIFQHVNTSGMMQHTIPCHILECTCSPMYTHK